MREATVNLEEKNHAISQTYRKNIQVYVVYESLFQEYSADSPDPSKSLRSCVMALFSINLIYCVLNLRDSQYTSRPHPAFWRMVHGASLFYFYFLIVLVVVPPESGKKMVHDVFPKSVAPGMLYQGESSVESTRTTTPQPNLGNWHLNCEMTASTFWRQLTSLWFIAHIIGWWAKMCIFRDWGLCIAYSFMFEAAELSLQSLIPEFQECWWDSIILDALGANMIGLYLGHLTLNYLNCREYNWLSWEETRGIKQKLKRGKM